MNRFVPFVAVIGVVMVSAPNSSAEVLTPEQIEKLIAELTRLEQNVTSKRLEGRRGAVDAFRKGASGEREAYDLYMLCAKQVDFDQQGKSSGDFREWRERQEANLKKPSRMTAMRMQLQYLVLTLRMAEGESALKLVPEVESFLASVVSNADSLEGDLTILQRDSVMATPFAKAYELDQSVKMENWGFVPGNIGQVYERFILPTLRGPHPELVGSAWDRRIQLEGQLLQAVRKNDPVAMAKFSDETLPRLQWRRSEDIFKVGQQRDAAVTMLKLLTEHGDHPDATNWIASFRELLMPPAPEEE